MKDPRPYVLVLPKGVRVSKGRRATAPADLAETLAAQIRYAGLPQPLREHKFALKALGREWRFDLCWPDRMLAVEVEGLTGGEGGRHQRMDGFEEDATKYAEAALLGWTVYRVTGRQVKSGEALRLVERVLGEKRE